MKGFQAFRVYPLIPEPLIFLDYLSKNLWWCWNYDAVELFRRINPVQWENHNRNPVPFLASIPQRKFQELAADESFIGHLERVKNKFEAMFSFSSKKKDYEFKTRDAIAYFSMEFGLHESLPFFAGGLGVLAGDHLKASSSLGIPLTGIGLLFRGGYFRQYLDHSGWQQEAYPENDIFDLPVQQARDNMGNEVIVRISTPGMEVKALVWQVKVGRCRLLLLDTNIIDNPPWARDITARLYSSNPEIRIAQEALLGIGGMRALKALDIFPGVCHMNEGHCSFAILERLVQIMERFNLDLNSAWEICSRTSVFTSHTPVAAGHDEFPPSMIDPYIDYYAKKFKTGNRDILSWGQAGRKDMITPFSMCALGINLSGYINGVSRLHGVIGRNMWSKLWPEKPVDEIPVTSITNGVHILSYISQHKAALFERYLATDWGSHPCTKSIVDRLDNIDDEDLWHVHGIDRSRLIRACRKLLLKQYLKRSAPRKVLDGISAVLDNDVLTICFARRFATYKRADLILQDPDRLTSIINSRHMPVQFVIAGKAHPNDREGKEIIKRIVDFAKQKELRHRFVFLEDYDINIARYMVQGADVWLNTPRRPNEACGTSGIKAAVNGGLNLSIMDGWWCEGFSEKRGWRIGKGEDYNDLQYQDIVESQTLYNLLEDDVIPCFYERKRGNPPETWIKMMKESMKMALLNFSSHRMVNEYAHRFYMPSFYNMEKLSANRGWEARDLAETRQRITGLWKEIRIDRPSLILQENYLVGDTFRVTANVFLGEILPEEVEVQIYYGRMQAIGQLKEGQTKEMKIHKDLGHGQFVYACSLTCSDSGRFGYTARVIPKGDVFFQNSPGLITWAED
ncbi:MAG: alpha-glucan family phosphorylase [Thermodesulfobacteriota bacterium]|nr:alpha-glucan family phosphorylase [Thermodesulfobacteriota bacterium]